MNLFFIGEYGHMMVASALMVTFFLGGYQIPFVSPEAVLQGLQSWLGAGNLASILNALIHHAVFMLKLFIMLWLFIHVRWSLPRFRYDQLMSLGWKTMLPWALGNLIVTAILFVILKA
jgi:NADH-quinone oxidoreductase subunit H